MFISDVKVFNVASSGSVYGLVEGEFCSWIVQFVDERTCFELLITNFISSEGKKQTSVDTELFNSNSPFGWQILICFELMQAARTILGGKKKPYHWRHKRTHRDKVEIRSTTCHHNVRFGRGSTSAPPPISASLSPPIFPKKELLTLNTYFIFERCSKWRRYPRQGNLLMLPKYCKAFINIAVVSSGSTRVWRTDGTVPISLVTLLFAYEINKS